MSNATAASRATASASAISFGLQSPTARRDGSASTPSTPLQRDDRRRQDGANAVLGRARGRRRGCRRRAPASRERRRRPPCGGARAREVRRPAAGWHRRAAAHPRHAHSAATAASRSPRLAEPDEAAGRVDRERRLLETATAAPRRRRGATGARARRARSAAPARARRRARSSRRDRSSASPASLTNACIRPSSSLVEHARAADGAEDDARSPRPPTRTGTIRRSSWPWRSRSDAG